MDTIGGMGTVGDWREFPYDEVKQHVLQLAGNPDLSAATVAADKADGAFNHAKGEITSILQTELESGRSEEHTSELQSLMRISYAVFCLKKQKHKSHTKL